ncbi:hypothetical protein AVEN_42626-1 [Araneus ventricosus]|uniref:Uncharacterized protein n=1 Tax=Araneus ventricosus TaxID=182803 RepID=A0A4Y2BPP6_ARAVE|nr:hypothetical protein AVEN_42626-1 [Araneus ventricosus]
MIPKYVVRTSIALRLVIQDRTTPREVDRSNPNPTVIQKTCQNCHGIERKVCYSNLYQYPSLPFGLPNRKCGGSRHVRVGTLGVCSSPSKSKKAGNEVTGSECSCVV